MMRHFLYGIAFAFVTLASAQGCGPAASTVTGEVTVDGKPMAKGVISFTPPSGVAVTANVVEGRYEIRTAPGEQRVQISMPVVLAKRKDSNAPDAKVIEITEEKLPPHYHTKSELKMTAPAGASTKDWPLDTKSRKP